MKYETPDFRFDGVPLDRQRKQNIRLFLIQLHWRDAQLAGVQHFFAVFEHLHCCIMTTAILKQITQIAPLAWANITKLSSSISSMQQKYITHQHSCNSTRTVTERTGLEKQQVSSLKAVCLPLWMKCYRHFNVVYVAFYHQLEHNSSKLSWLEWG